jgi:diphthamide biosynthesis enzyme Dph1/Dph2-like protein
MTSTKTDTNNILKGTSILLIPAKYTKKITIPKHVIDRIPNRLMLFSSVQFLNQISDIAKDLENSGKEILLVKSKNFLYEGMISEKGQLLGCNAETFDINNVLLDKREFDAFLYIGDGVFHPKALLVNNQKDIYCYDPKIDKIEILKK